jgi:hypothetical protein
MKYVISSILLVGALFSAKAQTALHQYGDNTNAWFMYFGSHKVSERWGLHLEAQWRRSDFVSSPQQLLLRTGINYHFNAQVSGTLGYCFVQTYPYGELPAKSEFPEDRIWEQIQIKTQLQAFEWVSRFRLEQRFVYAPMLDRTTGQYAPGDAVYSNRFRVLNRFSIPFKGKVIAEKSLYLSVYDEILVNFGKNVANNIFDQNRLYIALGYRIPKAGRLEIGFLDQIIQKPDGVKIERNATFQLGFTSNVDFYKKNKS